MRIFGPIAAANIVVDMIIQNAGASGDTDVTFTIPQVDQALAEEIIRKVAAEIGAASVTADTDVAKVSVVGLGMRSHAGVAAKMFEVMAREEINVEMISTSEIKISVVVRGALGERAVRALHAALVADAPADGTGR